MDPDSQPPFLAHPRPALRPGLNWLSAGGYDPTTGVMIINWLSFGCSQVMII